MMLVRRFAPPLALGAALAVALLRCASVNPTPPDPHENPEPLIQSDASALDADAEAAP